MFGRKGREMTYWHMQLHPTDEEDNYDAGVIVKETELIGKMGTKNR